MPPTDDDGVPAFWRALGLPGLADIHVHFLPPRMLRRVWAYFDEAGPLVGVTWPIRYRWTDGDGSRTWLRWACGCSARSPTRTGRTWPRT